MLLAVAAATFPQHRDQLPRLWPPFFLPQQLRAMEEAEFVREANAAADAKHVPRPSLLVDYAGGATAGDY